MKQLLIFLTGLFFYITLNAQQQEEPLSLTPAQMVEDFEYLCDIIEKTNPRIPVWREVTGTDPMVRIRNMRPYLDTIPTSADFYNILLSCFNYCWDKHCGFSQIRPVLEPEERIKEASDITYRSVHYLRYFLNQNPFMMYYVNGDYFVPEIFNENEEVIVPLGARLTAINEMPIDDYIDKWMTPVYSDMRWDLKNDKPYARQLFNPLVTGESENFKITYVVDGETRKADLTSFYKMKFPTGKGSNIPKIHYLDEDEILYIRIPAMDFSKRNYYKEEIVKYREHSIRKVVVDIRSNRGGNDQVWIDVLAALIDQPIETTQILCYKESELTRKYIREAEIGLKKYKESSLYIGQDTCFCFHTQRVIEPAENTINYTGNIYILTDENSFSSSLSLAAYSESVDRLVRVGYSGGFLGGQGATPFSFILPNSKLIFAMESSMDATDVKEGNWSGYFHAIPQIEVEMDFNSLYRIKLYPDEYYEKEFLYNADPVFAKVLALP